MRVRESRPAGKNRIPVELKGRGGGGKQKLSYSLIGTDFKQFLFSFATLGNLSLFLYTDILSRKNKCAKFCCHDTEEINFHLAACDTAGADVICGQKGTSYLI